MWSLNRLSSVRPSLLIGVFDFMPPWVDTNCIGQVNAVSAPKRTPWNKGKLTGAKPPLRPKHVWSIRTKLQIEGRARDLAMFNLAIDSKLRGCDVVAIR